MKGLVMFGTFKAFNLTYLHVLCAQKYIAIANRLNIPEGKYVYERTNVFSARLPTPYQQPPIL